MKKDRDRLRKIMNKKGIAISQLPMIVMIFVVIVIMIAVGSLIVVELQDSFTDTSTAGYNATKEGEASFQTFAEQLPLLALVLVFAVIITVVVGSLLPRAMG